MTGPETPSHIAIFPAIFSLVNTVDWENVLYGGSKLINQASLIDNLQTSPPNEGLRWKAIAYGLVGGE